MAKKTKSADLSIEEKLEQALVVPGYEPYKIPDNWCWVRMNSISNFERGITFPASAKEKEKSFANIPCLRTANVQETLDISDLIYVDKTYMKNNPAKLVKKKDILMSIANSKELVGKTSLINSFTGPMTFGGFVMAIRSKIVADYLFYYLRNEFYSGRFIGDSTQTTNIANINSTMLGQIETPVPPLAEQQRIVERIESLFSKLDEAKEKAQEVIDSFEARKAAILHKAFSGELTAKWREENGVGIESWESTKIGDMLTEIKYGTSEKSDYSFDGIPVFRIPNIGDMTLIFDDVKKIQRQECSENEYLSENDILIIRSNGSKELVGKCALVPKINFKCTYASFLIRLRMKDSISSLYTVWYLTSEQARKQLFNKAKSSAGIHNINSKEISDISIVVPSKPEQNIITATLERLITKEKETVIFAESVIDQIDAMKKTILARAFRGELGTNDPEEESAVELLKQILSGE